MTTTPSDSAAEDPKPPTPASSNSEPQPSSTRTGEAAAPKPSALGKILGGIFGGVLRWLVPIRKTVDPDDGTYKLIYTSFPKSFYFYLIWLPGFVVLALHDWELASPASLVWTLLISCVIAYLVIAEDFRLTEFLLWITTIALGVTLYRFGVLDFAWLQSAIERLQQLQLAFDPPTIRVLTWGAFLYWCATYLFSVTWRKRELSSNRRAKLRPPRGKKIIPVVGRIVDNTLVDTLELILGFGAYDVVISETSGRELDRDKNCVGLGFFINFFSDLVGRIATQEAGIQAAIVAQADAQESSGTDPA